MQATTHSSFRNLTVQGVQSVQGTKNPTQHTRKHSNGAGLRVSVQGVHGTPFARMTTHAKNHQTHIHDNAFIVMYPAHPARPAQTLLFVASRCAGYFFVPCTPCTYLFLLIMRKKIVCGEDNAKAFNDALRASVPEFHALAKALYQAGLITGLAGSTLETDIDPQSQANEAGEAEKQCQDCAHWSRDMVGDGTGAGLCAVGGWPNKLKWPAQGACRLLERKDDV